jgi:hypothetical protein
MAKGTRTTKELAAWIAVEIGVGEDAVKVDADPAMGWHATVIAAPGQAAGLQRRADLAASELRALFDLKD